MYNRKLDYIIFFGIFILIIGFLFLSGCESCDIGEIQCDGDIIEVCIGESWQDKIDCSWSNGREGFNFTCCDYAKTAYCVPEQSCKEIGIWPEE